MFFTPFRYRIGLQEGQILCDIGAGSGIFSIPAALITKNTVYAVEINNEMLSIIEAKAEQKDITNIRLIEVQDNHYEIEDNSVDITLMVTVLHEIDNKAVILEEVKRILKSDGKFAVVEFHKLDTPMGPPIIRRMAKDDVQKILCEQGLVLQDSFDLGENFYCMIFGK